MMSSAETSEELMLNKPTSKSTTTNRSQPIHFINANKKAVDTSSNSRAVMSSDHYHHVHHIYTAPHFHTTNSLLEYFYSTSYGQQQQHSNSYLSTSAGKIATNNTLNQAKSNGVYLNDLINEFSNNKVSAFLPPEEIIINDQVGAKNEIVSRIFSEVQEVQEGKVDNVLRVMSFHPEFLQEFINLYNYLMYSQHGALPYDWRHYIAIMAAARHKCIYLVKQQEREFLNQNGQSAWLKHGIAHIPHKLKGLCELNKLLCHQPWLINHTHLEKILKGQFSWTVTELTMAITILTLFHSLSGFAFGCGINENYTQELSRQYEREEEENAAKHRAAKRCAGKKSSKKLSKQHDAAENNSSSNTTRSSRTVVMNKNGGSTSSSSGVIGCIDGVEDEFESESEDQQAPDDDDEENYGEEEDDVDEDDEDDEDEDEDYYEQDEDEDQEYEEDGEEESRHSDRRLIDNDEHEDEDLETGVDGRFLPQAASVASAATSRHYGRSNRVKTYSSNAAASGSSAATHSAANSASTGGRGRSNSTGASNRTLSNSSASSCELGIDMLLKEMQMIKAEDKQNQQQQHQQTKTSESSLSSSMLSSSCSGTTATTPSSSSSSSSLIMIQKQLAANRSNSPATQQCLSPASIGGNLPGSGAASSSGPSTITNNSPTAATVANNQSYSSSNDVSNRQQYQSASHDNNNNSIHHYNYHHQHHYNQPSNHHHHQNHTYHNANNTVMNTNLSKDMNEIMRNEEVEKSDDENKSNNKMKFMESSSSSNKGYHINHHMAPQQQQQQQHQQQPVSAHEAIVAQKIRDYMLKYAYDADYGYEDVEASGDPSLRLEYYTWENQGYITAQSVYPDICDFLDKNFQVAANMTYNTMGNVKGVDTSLFRKAVWFYTHSLYGVRHDDYDYNQIRALLKSPLRKYIKMVCTQPERITKSHYDSIMKEFAHSEKVHMNLVIMEARIQASMLYFLRAVNSYFG